MGVNINVLAKGKIGRELDKVAPQGVAEYYVGGGAFFEIQLSTTMSAVLRFL